MTMTHYMELIGSNQPWNLIIFMAIPAILAETVAITELYTLFTRKIEGTVRTISKVAGISVGIYFVCIALYLLVTAVIPLTISGGWRGPADVIAVLAYVSGVIPLAAIALIDLGLALKREEQSQKIKWHAVWVAVFLVVAHIAMIFGMLNPGILGYKVPAVMPMNGSDMNMAH